MGTSSCTHLLYGTVVLQLRRYGTWLYLAILRYHTGTMVFGYSTAQCGPTHWWGLAGVSIGPSSGLLTSVDDILPGWVLSTLVDNVYDTARGMSTRTVLAAPRSDSKLCELSHCLKVFDSV